MLPPIIDLKGLRSLVSQGEGQQLEFKRKAKFPDKIVKELVAFSNTDGGWLLIGVDDDGTVVGCPNVDEEEYVMVKAIAQYIVPDLLYSLKKIRVQGEHTVLAIAVQPQGEAGPFAVVTDPTGRDRTTYVRKADESLQASREMREVMKYRRKFKETRVQIGEKEKLLFQYLDKFGHITLTGFCDLAKITTKVASRTLVLLTLNGVLQLEPQEGGDVYSLKIHEPS